MKRILNVVTTLAIAGFSMYGPASSAAVYCNGPGVPVGCVVRPMDRGAPGVGVAPRAGVGAPGVGAGAPGVGVDGDSNRGGPQDRAGRR